jgi:hypothetical protein
MKQVILIISCCLVAAGLCLAQRDSIKAKPDSVKVSIEVQNAGNDDASVTVTTEKGMTDSTVTVSINSGGKRGKLARLRRNWVLGVRSYSLSSLPGSLLLQRIVSKKLFVGCGFNYSRNPGDIYLPGINSGNWHEIGDNWEQTNSYSAWSVQLTPECIVPVMTRKHYRLSTGLTAGISYAEARGDYEYVYIHNPADTTRTVTTGHGKSNSYSVSVPVIIERGFRVRKQTFFVGLQSSILSLDYSKQASESEETRRSTVSPAQIYRRANSRTYPSRLTLRNPFEGNVSLLLKWYL